MKVFEALQPPLFWKHFATLCRIPRCSGEEAAISKKILSWAADLDLEAEQDQVGNLIIRVPASRGREAAPGVILQGHLDMVCEKNADSPHDFSKDPIPVIRDGEYIATAGTTLGADNGVAIAAAMAIAEGEHRHGPLELLFTVDEERGLTGALGLQPSLLKGRYLLNLDTEEEGAIYMGCAGGGDSLLHLPLEYRSAQNRQLKLIFSGLQGGHSGMDINSGRGNALKLLVWLLDYLRDGLEFQLLHLQGGDKHNAIPREAWAQISVMPEQQVQLDALLESFREELSPIYTYSEPKLKLSLEEAPRREKALSLGSRDRLLDLLLSLPHGVLAMSQGVAGLVETSNNLAVVRTGPKEALIHLSSRSSIDAALRGLRREISAQGRLAGAEVEQEQGYPGWQPNPDSALLRRASQVHEELFGTAPEAKAIHAGLECGLIGQRYPGMDMISFGPDMERVHSPSERLKIDSVERFFGFLSLLLDRLST